MRIWTLVGLGLLASACGAPAEKSPEVAAPPPQTAPKLWVTTQYADRHSCPSARCGIVGRLFFREAAEGLERRDGWVRVTKLYDAACENGRSAYVDKGSSACTPENGVQGGRFAEWVRQDQLSATHPPDPAATATADERLVSNSDDFRQHRKAFVRAAQELIAEGRCQPSDFEEMGGWMKSSNHRDQPIYFTYCGSMTTGDRLYLDARSGRIFK